MKKKSADANLGGGHADAFGINHLGQGYGINPLWGAVAGSGLGTLTAIGVRQAAGPTSALQKWSEAIGFAVGGGVSAAMLISDSTRAAGWTGLASAFLNNGLRQIERLMLAPATPTPTTTPTTTTPTVTGPVVEPTQVLQGAGNQMGLVSVEPATALLGAGYSEGQYDMPKLVGASIAAANAHIKSMGGPPLSQFASHWGATHFSGRS